MDRRRAQPGDDSGHAAGASHDAGPGGAQVEFERTMSAMEESFHAEGVRGILHRPASPNGSALVLTHGASSNCNAPLLVRLAGTFADAGYLVLRYDLPFRQQRPRGSPFPAGAARDREG